MLKQAISAVTAIISIGISAIQPVSAPKEHVLATHTMSLGNRQPDPGVNEVFKDNILLDIAYLDGKAVKNQPIKWDEITQPFQYQFKLSPNQTFAFHDDVLPKYQGKIARTTNAHFNSAEGFKSDGYLVGDGVCHLASLIYWVAKDAHLDAYAPTNHDFAKIEGISREYGVAIYNQAGSDKASAMQNLYITNNHQSDVEVKFDYNGRDLNVSVLAVN